MNIWSFPFGSILLPSHFIPFPSLSFPNPNPCSALSLFSAVVESIREVLEDDADPFVVKLWRFLIYETEAKKYGLPAQ